MSQNACVIQVTCHYTLYLGTTNSEESVWWSGSVRLQLQQYAQHQPLLYMCLWWKLYPTCSVVSSMGKTSVSTTSLDLSCAGAPPPASSCCSPCMVGGSRWLLGGLILSKSTPPHRGSPLDVLLPAATPPQLLGSSPPGPSEPILPSPSSLASPSAYLVCFLTALLLRHVHLTGDLSVHCAAVQQQGGTQLVPQDPQSIACHTPGHASYTAAATPLMQKSVAM